MSRNYKQITWSLRSKWTALTAAALCAIILLGSAAVPASCSPIHLRYRDPDVRMRERMQRAQTRSTPPSHWPAPHQLQLVDVDSDVEVISVLDFGADPTGAKDSTEAFQAALKAAAPGSGPHPMTVYAPIGIYTLVGSISIPPGVTLSGSYRSVTSHVTPNEPPTDGTVLMPTGGRGDPTGVPCVNVGDDSTLRGVAFFYPDQASTGTPAPYPFAIGMSGNNAAVTDTELINAYQGINATGAHRHYIARVMGQPLYIGLWVDATYDIGRVEDVHWNPWWSQNVDVTSFMALRGRGFVFARSDWEYVFNTFCFCYAVGYHFIVSDVGTINANLLGLGADLAFNASVLVEGAQPPGLLFTNGEFTSFGSNTSWCPSCQQSNVQVRVMSSTAGSNGGPVRFVNSAFWGPSTNIAVHEGDNLLAFSDCTFVQWGLQPGEPPDQPALLARSGNLLVTGCEFQQPSSMQLQIDSGVRKVIFTNNMVAGSLRIQNNAPAAVVILGNNAPDSAT